jgi:cell division protein FtsL
MMLRINILLVALLLGSCVWLIRSSHESRRLVYELEKSQAAARELQLDFERLELDKRAQATPLRVEKLAREKLRMFGNNPAVTHYVAASAGAASAAASAAAAEARP